LVTGIYLYSHFIPNAFSSGPESPKTILGSGLETRETIEARVPSLIHQALTQTPAGELSLSRAAFQIPL